MIKVFLDMDGTLAKFNVRGALKRYDKQAGFFSRLGAYVGIEKVNELAKTGQLFIISSSPNEQADADKTEWLNTYLPNIPQENITFCRVGVNKAEVVANKYGIQIDTDTLLLDDYTKNLREWEDFGGKGVKRITYCSDNSRKLWTGLTLKDLRKIGQLLSN